MKKVHVFYILLISLILSALVYAGVDSSKVQVATKDGSFVAAANPLPTTTRFSLFSTPTGLKVNTNGSFINITSETIFAKQSGTWFSNITGVNGSVRARQSGTWFANITGINGSVRARQSGTWNVRQRNYTSFLNTTKPYQSSLTTAFNNNTTGVGSSINLGHLVSSHTWSIKSTKKTADTSWTITLDGSLDDTDFESLDTFSTRTSFNLRHIANKPVEYIRARVVQRGYTGIRPAITIKTKSISGN